MIAHPILQRKKLEEAFKVASGLALAGHTDALAITSPADWDEGVYFELRIIQKGAKK